MNNVFIIAEAGVNHNGNLNLALDLCDKAKIAGVDAIKFQTWKTENVVTKDTILAKYQANNTLTKSNTQYELLKKIELEYDDFSFIKTHCDKIGIKFISTADEEESLEYLINIGVNILKVGSGEITNIPFLRKVASKKLPVILSTGMSSLEDVDRAFRILKNGNVPKITLLHCTTNYPCPMDEVNLMAMKTLQHSFNCDVGYSDHTLGTEVSIAAVALGAKIIEKHFTLDRSMDGPDHIISVNPQELGKMVREIRNIEKALGNGIKEPNKSELEISKVVLKSIVANCPILEGEFLSDANLTVKRTSKGISAKYWDLLIGTRALRDFSTDEPISIKEDE